MKVTKLLLAFVFCLAFTVNSNAQFVEKMAKKAKQKVEREAEKRTERRIDNELV